MLFTTTLKYLSYVTQIILNFLFASNSSWTQKYLAVSACSILFLFSTSYPAWYHLNSRLLESLSQIRPLAWHGSFWLSMFQKVNFSVHLISTCSIEETTTQVGWKRKIHTSEALNSEKLEEIKMSISML